MAAAGAPDSIDLLVCFGGLVTAACISIYAGSVGSLPSRSRSKTEPDKRAAESDSDSEEETIEEPITSDEAWLFPVFGSIVLFSLWLLLRYIGPELVNKVLKWLFAFMAFLSVWKASTSLARVLVGERFWKAQPRIKLLLTSDQHNRDKPDSKKTHLDLLSLSFRPLSLLLLPLSTIPPVVYLLPTVKTPPIAFNVMSFSLAHTALSTMKLDRFRTGAILLSGLFLYDIFWVFGSEKVVGSNVMVAVATNLDAPIKILWPKSKYIFHPFTLFDGSKGFALLGGGDIIVPGLWCGLCLRFDWHSAGGKGQSRHFSFPKPFFWTSLAAYAFGLITTIVSMQVFQAAQPALLYISPPCLVFTILVAYIRGVWRPLWDWVDEEVFGPEHAETKTNGEDKEKKE